MYVSEPGHIVSVKLLLRCQFVKGILHRELEDGRPPWRKDRLCVRHSEAGTVGQFLSK